MVTLEVSGMVCEGCEKSVRQAITGKDPGAVVTVSRETGRVEAETRLSAEEAATAVAAAGFEARPAAS